MKKIVLLFIVFCVSSGFVDMYPTSESNTTQQRKSIDWTKFTAKLQAAPHAIKQKIWEMLTGAKNRSIQGYHYVREHGISQSVKNLFTAMIAKGNSLWRSKNALPTNPSTLMTNAPVPATAAQPAAAAAASATKPQDVPLQGLAELPNPSPTTIQDMFPIIIHIMKPLLLQGQISQLINNADPNNKFSEPDVIYRTRLLTQIESIVQNPAMDAKSKLLEFHKKNLAGTVHLNIDAQTLSQMSVADFGEVLDAEVEKIKEGLELISRAYAYFGAQKIVQLFEQGQGGCFNATITYLQDQYGLTAHPEQALFIPDLSVKDTEAQRFYKLFPVYLNKMAKAELQAANQPVNAETIEQITGGGNNKIDKHLNIKCFLEWGIKNGYISYTLIKADGHTFAEQFKPMINNKTAFFCVKNATVQAIAYFNDSGYGLDPVLNGKNISKMSDLDITNLLGIDVKEK